MKGKLFNKGNKRGDKLRSFTREVLNFVTSSIEGEIHKERVGKEDGGGEEKEATKGSSDGEGKDEDPSSQGRIHNL